LSDLATDSLLATVGLLPDAITPADVRAAERLPGVFSKRADAWWDIEDRPKWTAPKLPDFDKLFDKLGVEPSRTEIEAWLRAVGDDDDGLAAFVPSLMTARNYLVAQWPRIVLSTFAGPRIQALSIDAEAEVASLWLVLNDPASILDEMDAATMSPSQAEAFRNAYPALSEFHRMALAEGAAKRTTRDPEWMPTEEQTVILSILTGQPPGVLDYVTETPAENQPKPEKDLGAGAAETQLDKTAKPKSAK